MKQINMPDFNASLHELGLNSKTIAEITTLLQNGDTATAAIILRHYKQQLLSNLHKAGQKVDLLDFLLYQIKNFKNQ